MKDGSIDLLTLCTLAATAAIAGALLVLLSRGPVAREHIDFDRGAHVAQAWVAGIRGQG